MAAFVILSEAKNLMDSSTYTSEILRLPPQNDAVGQPQREILDLRLQIDTTWHLKISQSAINNLKLHSSMVSAVNQGMAITT